MPHCDFRGGAFLPQPLGRLQHHRSDRRGVALLVRREQHALRLPAARRRHVLHRIALPLGGPLPAERVPHATGLMCHPGLAVRLAEPVVEHVPVHRLRGVPRGRAPRVLGARFWCHPGGSRGPVSRMKQPCVYILASRRNGTLSREAIRRHERFRVTARAAELGFARPSVQPLVEGTESRSSIRRMRAELIPLLGAVRKA